MIFIHFQSFISFIHDIHDQVLYEEWNIQVISTNVHLLYDKRTNRMVDIADATCCASMQFIYSEHYKIIYELYGVYL